MSSEAGMDFGSDFGPKYKEVVDKWTGELKKVPVVTQEMEDSFSKDLMQALAVGMATELAINFIPVPGAKIPYKETLDAFAKTAVLTALAVKASKDLIHRLHDRVKNEDNPKFEPPGETALRAPQTVAQIYDMGKDAFNKILGRFYQKQEALTGRRRWRTVGAGSRHRRVEGQIKEEGENFNVNGRSVYGPRPFAGSPAHWSNCSCYLEFETSEGNWVRLSK